MNCPACGFENREDAGFCGECGASLARELRCPRCERSNPRGRKFCDGCGHALGESTPEAAERDPRDYTPNHLAEKILQSKSALEGERKQVTVLFADVKGSLELAEQVDPEEWHRILDRFFQILASGVHRFEGTVNQYTGDGIMALFGAPIAHEDHAQRACYAALHLKDELRRYADELRRTKALNFSVRMGLNSGEVIVGKIGDDLRMDYTAQGHTVGLAQRIEQLAPPETTYLTEQTAHLVEGLFRLRDLGEFDLKGAAQPARVFELEQVGTLHTRLDVSRARGFSKFVGRADEMATLKMALHRALEGKGQVVGVVGEAGVGKSRLCLEFVERCRAESIRVLEAHCPAHGRTVPFLPLLELLRNFFGVVDRDADQEVRQKIAGTLVLLDEAFQETLPLVFDFLGVPDPDRPAPPIGVEARQQQLFTFVRRLVAARSAREPAVLLVDDLHWVDAGSDAFLAQLVEATSGTRTMFLVNFRPEYHAEWMGKPYYQQLPLLPLGREAIDGLLEDLLGRDSSLAGLSDRIRERTGGNPFFIEEVVQSLVESGSLEGTKGAYLLVKPVEEVAVPPTVQAVVAARIDRLGEREKQVLQTAAVIGKEFAAPVLERVVELGEAELAGALSALQAAEFIHERALYPVTQYAFKHPLTHEVALGSQLHDRRRRIHDAVARAIEEIHSEKLDEQAALLAHHWDGAGQPLPAARWHLRAAEWAGATHAGESLRHYREVRRLLDETPETEETIDLGVEAREHILNILLRAFAESEDVAGLLDEGRELARRSQNPHVQIRFLRTVGVYRLYSGEVGESVAPLEEARQLADDLGDAKSSLNVRYFLAISSSFAGMLPRALRAMDESLELLERGDAPDSELLFGYDPRVATMGLRGWVLAKLGRFTDADASLARAIEVAHRRDDVRSISIAESWAGMAAEYKGDVEQALSHSRRAVEAAERIPAASILANAYWALGFALLLKGQHDEAAEALERVIERGTGLQKLAVMSSLSLAYLGRGEPDRARACAEESLAEATRSGARLHECGARLALATVLLRTGGASAREQVEAQLARAQDLIETTGDRARQSVVPEARAELARLLGDEATWERELRHAHRLYTEMGATGHAERLAKELSL